MLKKIALTASIFAFGASMAYAAGGEINAQIQQSSSISSSKVIGAPKVEFEIGDNIPFVGGIKVGFDGQTKINEITNSGTLGGVINQKSVMQDTVLVGSQVNTIDNQGTVSEGSEIIQTSNMNGEGNVIVGASVNRVVNKK